LKMTLDILAFGAHPDDVELFAGGTLAKMAALGHKTGIIDMTRGELGSRGTRALRAREARNAAAILGLTVRESLSLPDGEVAATPAARLKVIRVLRKYRPTVVLTHYWEDKHPDHVNTSRLVSEAAHHSGLLQIKTGQERFRPNGILYFKLPPEVSPSFVVDVSKYSEQRTAAIAAYASQLYDPYSTAPATYLSQPDFLAHVANLHAYYGILVGASIGEGFHTQGLLEMEDPVAYYGKQGGYRYRY
jgi:bacillithiol biosynthesis deacetylase BshB1